MHIVAMYDKAETLEGSSGSVGGRESSKSLRIDTGGLGPLW